MKKWWITVIPRLVTMLAAATAMGGTLGGVAWYRHGAPTACHSDGVLPDAKCTPGAIAETNVKAVCNRSTRLVRPPVSYTNKLKKQQIGEYGYSDKNPAHYEQDHLVPLELGGHPTDPRNEWPEPIASAREKDIVENTLHREVCAETLALRTAQAIMSVDWTQGR